MLAHYAHGFKSDKLEAQGAVLDKLVKSGVNHAAASMRIVTHRGPDKARNQVNRGYAVEHVEGIKKVVMVRRGESVARWWPLTRPGR